MLNFLIFLCLVTYDWFDKPDFIIKHSSILSLVLFINKSEWILEIKTVVFEVL